jgi:hypothetical protein
MKIYSKNNVDQVGCLRGDCSTPFSRRLLRTLIKKQTEIPQHRHSFARRPQQQPQQLLLPLATRLPYHEFLCRPLLPQSRGPVDPPPRRATQQRQEEQGPAKPNPIERRPHVQCRHWKGVRQPQCESLPASGRQDQGCDRRQDDGQDWPAVRPLGLVGRRKVGEVAVVRPHPVVLHVIIYNEHDYNTALITLK